MKKPSLGFILIITMVVIAACVILIYLIHKNNSAKNPNNFLGGCDSSKGICPL
jgi:preprotein translocase subunit SecG